MVSLSQFLDGLEISLTPFAVCEIRRGSGLVLQESRTPTLHYLLRGQGVMTGASGLHWDLPGNALVVVPAQTRVSVSCQFVDRVEFPEPHCEPIPGGWQWIEVGEGDPGIVMACAELHVTVHGIIGLFDYLNEPLVESMENEPAFKDAIELLLNELAFPKPGTPALAVTLMKQCLIVLLRQYWKDHEVRAPWLASVQDPQLGQAITAMVNQPGSPFTLSELAAIAGMSRTAFAARFREMFDCSPMEYLRETRLRRAARLLIGTDLPVKGVAEQVGFASRSHFTRAFRAFTGALPAEYRCRRGEREG